jgi:hypothetical protein
MDKDRAAGDRYIGGRLTVVGAALAARPLAHGADLTVIVKINVTAFEQETKAGKFVTGDGAHQGERFETSMSWENGAWRVVKLGLDQ